MGGHQESATVSMQTQFEVAVVIPTVLRPTLLRAVRSVFAQDLPGRIQILIGVDKAQGDEAALATLAAECPEHVALTVLDLGYSTSSRHGGLYANHYSGALRTILSYAANSRYVAYLDDDDWWGRGHLAALLAVLPGRDWAFSNRWLVDPETGWPICKDTWDSLGPGRGINQERYGGFVSPSNLVLDKLACHHVLPFWAQSPFPDGTGEDRLVFRELLQHPAWAGSGVHSCFYELPREAQGHAHHAREFATRQIRWLTDRSLVDQIRALTGEAEAALAAGAAEDAVSFCHRALALNRHHAASLRCLALAEARLGRREAALGHLAHALEVGDQDPATVAAWREVDKGVS